MSRLDRDKVYLVRSEDDRSALLALYPLLTDERVEWFDTIRDRGGHVESIAEDGGALAVKTANGTYRFEELTLELYRQYVQPKVEGHPELSSSEEVQLFYRSLPG